jgi:hypothetical protein
MGAPNQSRRGTDLALAGGALLGVSCGPVGPVVIAAVPKTAVAILGGIIAAVHLAAATVAAAIATRAHCAHARRPTAPGRMPA